MAKKKKIAVIFGTRPDTIKLAPVIKELEKQKELFSVLKIATAQHRQMLDQVLNVFSIKPDYDLNIMKDKQSLANITRDTISELDRIFYYEAPDLVIVQGDTTTTFLGSLAAFYQKIPVAHVEAGLRTDEKLNPYPEEVNRRLTSVITDLHLAPTETAKKALIKENIQKSDIFITGNTVIDSLDYAVKDKFTFSMPIINDLLRNGKKNVLITMHRRENWGEPMQNAAYAIKELAEKYIGLNFIFPIHLNPVVRNAVIPILENTRNIHIIEPLDYLDFVNLLAKSYLVLTDSGGVQEEGPHFGVPVLVLRTTTERPEAIEFGTAKLIGLNKENIIKNVTDLLDFEENYQAMSKAANPYGDGKASQRIVKILLRYFGFIDKNPREFKPKKRLL